MSAATGQSLVVGVEAMDDQRGILMDTLNELRQQIARESDNASLHQQMAWLVKFTDLHFGCEEALLRRYGFPGLEEHSVAHQSFLDRLRQAAEPPALGADTELHRLLDSLRNDFMEHVDSLDRRYAEWLNARGVF